MDESESEKLKALEEENAKLRAELEKGRKKRRLLTTGNLPRSRGPAPEPRPWTPLTTGKPRPKKLIQTHGQKFETVEEKRLRLLARLKKGTK